jgi:flagellar basal body-associated protein FliL
MTTILFITAIFLIVTAILMYVIIFLKKKATPKLSKEEAAFLECKIILINKETFTKKTIQKAQQYMDDFLEQKNSIASTTES